MKAQVEPAVLKDVAVQCQGVGAAGFLVQAIDVLRDHREAPWVALLVGGDGVVAGVGFDLGHGGAALGVPVPDELGLGTKAFFGGEFGGVEARPQAGLRVAERGDARFSAHAGAGQHGNVLRGLQPGAHLRKVGAGVRGCGHGNGPMERRGGQKGR
jgi:hypothetical protein